MIQLDFDKLDGLVPAIVQDYQSGEVLMAAFMNQEAWKKTLDLGIVHFWSRSRKSLWKKGISGTALQFDGDDDLIEIEGSSLLQGDEWTIIFWIKIAIAV